MDIYPIYFPPFKITIDKTTSSNASIVFYCFCSKTLSRISDFLSSQSNASVLRMGHFMEWLIERTSVYGMKLPEPFDLIGDVGLQEYRALLEARAPKPTPIRASIVRRVHARVGLVGNPSDGFFGKTISLSIANYWAEVTIRESERLVYKTIEERSVALYSKCEGES